MASRLRSYAALYPVLAGARIRADWQYRVPFVIFTVTQFLITFIDFLLIVVLFSRVSHLAGWSVEEVAFLYGASGIAFFIADVFVSQVERVSQYVKSGSMDSYLLRPVGALFLVCADDFALRRMGKLLQASLVFAVAITRLDIDWTLAKVGVVVTMLASGAVIFSAIFIGLASMTFWLVEGQEVMNAFTYGGHFASQYPVDILGPWLRRFVTLAIPTAFVSYFPATYLLGKPDAFGAPGWVAFLSPVIATVAAAVAALVWNQGVRHYSSTGS